MNILIMGSGGREEAIAFHLQEIGNNTIYTVPGNGAGASRGRNVSIDIDPPYTELITAIRERRERRERSIDLVAVGPENYLSDGVVDVLSEEGIPVFGPSKEASRLESSKIFAKEVMAAAGVPTATYREFHDHKAAEDFLRKEFRGESRWVLKADGLCAGKGVVVPATLEESLDALQIYFQKQALGVGERIIIEEFMAGEEASVLAFCDGKRVRSLPAAQDHKRIFDGDRGPNTGGMGAYTPVPVFRPGFRERVEKEILLPVIREMERRGIPYRGILYAGLMIEGERIRVVEFNVRFGDPECQCVLPLLKSDLVEVMKGCIEGRLGEVDFQVSELPAVSVVLSSKGYPGEYEIGKRISGLDRIPQEAEGVRFRIFHAGTRFQDGDFFTSGGRVLSVCGYAIRPGISLEKVITAVYEQVRKIEFEGIYYREDIGMKGLRNN